MIDRTSLRVLMLTIVACGAAGSPARGGDGATFEIARPFPEIVLPSASDGQPVSLSQFRGEMVLLHVFASW